MYLTELVQSAKSAELKEFAGLTDLADPDDGHADDGHHHHHHHEHGDDGDDQHHHDIVSTTRK